VDMTKADACSAPAEMPAPALPGGPVGEELALRDHLPVNSEIVDAEIVDLPERPDLPVPVPAALPPVWAEGFTERRPVIATWLRDGPQRAHATRWALSYLWHLLAFHGLRVPLYVLRCAAFIPRGCLRVAGWVTGWATDARSVPLIIAAQRNGDSKEYRALLTASQTRSRPRLIGLGVALLVVLVAGLALWRWGPGWLQLAVVLALAGLAGRAGQNPDRPLMDHAVLPGRVRKLSSGIVLRAFVAAKLCKDDDPITFAGPIMRDGAGWRVVCDLPYGRTADEAMERRGPIASGLDVDERCLFLTRVRGAAGSARRVAAWVADTDPLGVPAGPSPLIRAARVNFWEPFPFGLDERGEPVGLCLLWSSLLVGAVPRQGKTFAARTVALAAALDPHVRLHVYDLKGSPDWTGFRHVAHRWQLGDTPDPETGVDPVKALLDDMTELRAEVDHRYRTLRRLPAAVCPEGKLTEDLARSKQAGMPLVLVVIDEVQRAFTHREYGKELEAVLEDLVKVAPGAGIMVEAATQKPDQKSTPTAFRDQFTVRFALRVTTYHASEAILGAGAIGEGLDASKLSPEAKGAGLLRGTGDAGSVEGGRTVRTFLADGADAEAICVRARALRAAVGTLSGAALGEMPDTRSEVYSVAADLAVAMGADDQAHSEVLCARLAERWPGRYAEWKPAQLAAALKPHRVATRQVWADGLDGVRANRRGVLAADLTAVLDEPDSR
jgi:S-DNA-T family DNA segregation ATPase FtsK/SpoIIIE